MTDIAIIVLCLWSAVVFYNDYRSNLIPNYLSLGAIFVATFVLLVTGQSLTQQPISSAAAGFVVALVLTVPGYQYKLLGAGDVKLLCAIALLCGLQIMLLSFATASIGILFILILSSKVALFGKYITMPTKPKQKFIPFGAALVSAMMIVLLAPSIVDVNQKIGL